MCILRRVVIRFRGVRNLKQALCDNTARESLPKLKAQKILIQIEVKKLEYKLELDLVKHSPLSVMVSILLGVWRVLARISGEGVKVVRLLTQLVH